MTRDDIIRWALEAGFPRIGDKPIISCGRDELERFAALVASHEREECAKVCEAVKEKASELWDEDMSPYNAGKLRGAYQCAANIRARGSE